MNPAKRLVLSVLALSLSAACIAGCAAEQKQDAQSVDGEQTEGRDPRPTPQPKPMPDPKPTPQPGQPEPPHPPDPPPPPLAAPPK